MVTTPMMRMRLGATCTSDSRVDFRRSAVIGPVRTHFNCTRSCSCAKFKATLYVSIYNYIPSINQKPTAFPHPLRPQPTVKRARVRTYTHTHTRRCMYGMVVVCVCMRVCCTAVYTRCMRERARSDDLMCDVVRLHFD